MEEENSRNSSNFLNSDTNTRRRRRDQLEQQENNFTFGQQQNHDLSFDENMQMTFGEQAQNQDLNNNDEAVEDDNIDDYIDNGNGDSEEEEGEDLMENMERDYNYDPENDKYNPEGLDDQEYSDMELEDRKKAEMEIEERNRQRLAQYKREPQALLNQLEDDYEFEGEIKRQQRIQEQRQQLNYLDDYLDEFDDPDFKIDPEEAKGDLLSWIKQETTKKFIKSIFRKFLNNYQDENKKLIYKKKIEDMVYQNKQSITVDYTHLSKQQDLQQDQNQQNNYLRFMGLLAFWLADYPCQIIEYLNEVLFQTALQVNQNFNKIHAEVYVKVINYLIEYDLRDLKQKDISKLVRFQGVITKRSQVFSKLHIYYCTCSKCGNVMGPFEIIDEKLQLQSCYFCQSTGPFNVKKDQTIYKNFQSIKVQESPDKVPAGRVPRHIDVVLQGDNIDSAKPGDLIDITGVLKHKYDYVMNIKNGFPIFKTHLEAFTVIRVNQILSNQIDENMIKDIEQLKNNPNIVKKLINSVAPSIYGHGHIKTAIALSMFGGVPLDKDRQHRIRGDINVLILGDPGTAKSQFLKYVEKTFPRTVYTTGKGASAVGLTASVHRDFQTGEWVLQGGAMVIADQGICLIDEFDKMNDYDRTSIHEAMEQQTISISKAGIVASLQARCAVIAAANPIKGRYQSQQSFADNVELTDPILSRFDILCVIKDEPEFENDMNLASFIINSHIKNHPKIQLLQRYQKDGIELDIEDQSELIEVKNKLLDENFSHGELIDNNLLRNYIIYAREKCHPKINDIDKDRITKFYSDLRSASKHSFGGINIAPRHLESLIRISQAHAKMRLSNNVENKDIDFAISVILESFIQSQKFSVAKQLKKNFHQYIIPISDPLEDMYNELQMMLKQRTRYTKQELQNGYIEISMQQFKKELQSIGQLNNIQLFLQSDLFKNSFSIDESSQNIVWRIK